jgi:hypothetical protein
VGAGAINPPGSLSRLSANAYAHVPRVIAARHVLPLAMFLGTFSWSFVHVSLPFHVQRISTVDAAAAAIRRCSTS